MKKALLVIIVILYTHIVATDSLDNNPIEMAILKSDPFDLKKQLDLLRVESIHLSKRDQLKYLDLSEEIIIRRRHIVEFPFMSYARINRYLTHDKKPTLMPWLKITSGIIGSLIVIYNGFQYIPEDDGYKQFLCLSGLQILCMPFLYLFIKGAIEIDNDHNHPNILYEQALKVRQLLFDIQEI